MAKRQTERQRLIIKIDSLDDGEIRDVLNYISMMESTNHTTASRGPRDDELIAMLAEAHENKRARQAFEWEAVRRRAERRATALSTRT
jgi:hypothetical protein